MRITGRTWDEAKLLEIHSLLSAAEKPDMNRLKYGLNNVHRRLQLKFGLEYGLSVSRSPLGGLLIQLKLPLGDESHV